MLQAVTIVSDVKNKAIHANIGSQLRGHADWKHLLASFWSFTVKEAAQGPLLEACLRNIKHGNVWSTDWLKACQGLKAWAKELRPGRTDQLEAVMVTAIARLDSELELDSQRPDLELPALRQALAAEEGAISKLEELEQAVVQGNADVLRARNRIQHRLRKVRLDVLCCQAVTALNAAASNATVEGLAVACDSLRLAKDVAGMLTGNALVALEASKETLQEQTLKLPLDSSASFQLGYRMLDTQELVVVLSGGTAVNAAPALALLHAQKTAMQTWEAINAVELAVALTPGHGTLAAQQSAMDKLATCLADWEELCKEGLAAAGCPSFNPADALPAAGEARVHARGSAALGAYRSRNLENAFGVLQSKTLALELVAGGGDNGTSWKGALTGTATFQEVNVAARVLLRNAASMTVPLKDLQKAGDIVCSSRCEFLDRQPIPQHAQLKPASLSSNKLKAAQSELVNAGARRLPRRLRGQFDSRECGSNPPGRRGHGQDARVRRGGVADVEVDRPRQPGPTQEVASLHDRLQQEPHRCRRLPPCHYAAVPRRCQRPQGCSFCA